MMVKNDEAKRLIANVRKKEKEEGPFFENGTSKEIDQFRFRTSLVVVIFSLLIDVESCLQHPTGMMPNRVRFTDVRGEAKKRREE